MPEPQRTPQGCTRRSVLRATGLLLPSLTVGLVGGLSGCGVRWEGLRWGEPDAGPDLAAAATQLRLELARCLAAEEAASAAGGSGTLPGALARIHGQQVTVLRARLDELGAQLATDVATSGSSGTETGPRAANDPLVRLRAAERVGLYAAGRAALAAAPAAQSPLLGSLHVQRAVAIDRLGGSPVDWPALAVADEAEADRLLALTRAAEYGLAVAAAQASREQAAAARTGLGRVASRRRWLEEVSTQDVPAPLGHAVPFPVRSPQAAARVAVLVSRRLSEGTLAGLPAAAGQTGAVATALRWTVDSELTAVAWGAPLLAFPGLVTG